MTPIEGHKKVTIHISQRGGVPYRKVKVKEAANFEEYVGGLAEGFEIDCLPILYILADVEEFLLEDDVSAVQAEKYPRRRSAFTVFMARLLELGISTYHSSGLIGETVYQLGSELSTDPNDKESVNDTINSFFDKLEARLS